MELVLRSLVDRVDGMGGPAAAAAGLGTILSLIRTYLQYPVLSYLSPLTPSYPTLSYPNLLSSIR